MYLEIWWYYCNCDYLSTLFLILSCTCIHFLISWLHNLFTSSFILHYVLVCLFIHTYKLYIFYTYIQLIQKQSDVFDQQPDDNFRSPFWRFKERLFTNLLVSYKRTTSYQLYTWHFSSDKGQRKKEMATYHKIVWRACSVLTILLKFTQFTLSSHTAPSNTKKGSMELKHL